MMIARPKTSRSNNRGFTLLEVLVAMVITLIGLLGLLQSVNIATQHNVKNQMRDEGVQIAEESIGNLRARPFGRLSTSWSPRPVTGNLGQKFVLTRWATPMPNTNVVELRVKVGWSFKNVSSHHEVRTIRSR